MGLVPNNTGVMTFSLIQSVALTRDSMLDQKHHQRILSTSGSSHSIEVLQVWIIGLDMLKLQQIIMECLD